MYILCNEEPLWMKLCLGVVNRQLEYKDSWKKTALHQLDLLDKYNEVSGRTLQFDGFSSLFLYRRWYRCHTSLNGFSFDDGNVERKENISLEDFRMEYDCQKPVMISGLADDWPAKKSWTSEELLLKYSETKFRISQRSSKKIIMKFKDYVSYMQMQHDEDPLYIFDDKFGEVAQDLLKDYTVPHIFQEDYFDVLENDQRPPYRWLIIGPERSGASWHVDPGLTSAWNTLLCGRKRWALYPPGRVPLGVTVHVNEDDGDVNIETPSSLQWWLDFYPLLSEDDKPIECTQLPGETIYVPSGWWHCVLNLETTIAVTQNFVNSKNFEFVCLDMAPGYQHKGVCRAGLLALDVNRFKDIEKNAPYTEIGSSCSDLNRREKKARLENSTNDVSISNKLHNDLEYSYDISFLAKFLDYKMDHYTSLWSSGNCIGQREMRNWLWKLWVGRPGLRDLIWKGACLALNAGKWYERVGEICIFHELPRPSLDEKIPVGTGSNPVYLIDDYVIKIFAEGGLEASLYCLGTELQFYNLVHKLNSSLKNYIPSVVASGILLFKNGSYRTLPWDGRGIPEVIASSNLVSIKHGEVDYPFGLWAKKRFEYENAGKPLHESGNCAEASSMWPYVVTRRCRGRMLAELRETISYDDELNLASFLGEQLHNLHCLPVPMPHSSCNDSVSMVSKEYIQPSNGTGFSENVADKTDHPAPSDLFINILNKKREGVAKRLTEWGDPIPVQLIEKADEYIPRDLKVLYDNLENEMEASRSCTWIHSDVMDDNIYMIPCHSDSSLEEKNSEPCIEEGTYVRRSSNCNKQKLSWEPSYILDFSNLSAGEPILDLIPMYLDIFRGDSRLLKQFLDSYKLPFVKTKSTLEVVDNSRFHHLSYRAMCYCILHDENVLGAIFSIWRELRSATSWEEVEAKVWGDLNHYTPL